MKRYAVIRNNYRTLKIRQWDHELYWAENDRDDWQKMPEYMTLEIVEKNLKTYGSQWHDTLLEALEG